MKLRSRITIGTLGFLLISLTLCCTLMIYVSKKNMLNSTTSYTKTELEKLVANFYTNKSDIESTVEELTAETKLKYYFFKQTQYSDSDTEYVLQCGDEIIYNDSGLDAPTILGLNEDKSNIEMQGETKSDIVHTEGADYYIQHMVFVMSATAFISMRKAFVGNIWSNTAVALGYSKAGEALAVPASVKAMGMSTPYGCAAIVFLLMLCYSLILVFLMLLFNLKFGQIGGVLAAFGFSIYGFLLNPQTIIGIFNIPDYEAYKVNVWVGWVSPLNHATFYMHNFGLDMLPRLWQSYLICIVLVLVCFIAALWAVRGYNFKFTGTGGK